jgi:rRNA maturation protein Nop10
MGDQDDRRHTNLTTRPCRQGRRVRGAGGRDARVGRAQIAASAKAAVAEAARYQGQRRCRVLRLPSSRRASSASRRLIRRCERRKVMTLRHATRIGRTRWFPKPHRKSPAKVHPFRPLQRSFATRRLATSLARAIENGKIGLRLRTVPVNPGDRMTGHRNGHRNLRKAMVASERQ